MGTTDKIADIFITVRLKSSRLPQKALAEVEDLTIIEHIIRRAGYLKTASNVILCTSSHPEDQPLVEIAKKHGIPYFCGSENNIVDRFLGAAKLFNPDVVVRITGDNCLFSPEFIDHMIEEHIRNGVDYTSTKQLPGGGKGDVFSHEALVKLDQLLQDENASEYLSWLFADEEHFTVQWLDAPENIKRPQYRLHCDTPNDLQFIREVYKALYTEGGIVDFNTMIQHLDDNPDLIEINRDIKQVSKDMVESKINFDLK